MHLRKSLLCACALAVAAPASAAESKQKPFFGESFLRSTLGRFGVNSTVVDYAIKQASVPESPYISELTDANWEAILRTGTDDPLADPLPDETVWVIEVYGKDQTSKLFQDAFVATANHNSSAAGGSLPKNMRFARCDYLTETVLPTRWWIWKPPTMVIATKQATELRFLKIGHVRPFHEPMAALLSQRAVWEMREVWDSSKSRFAPGGSLEGLLRIYAEYWAWLYTYLAKIPSFVFLIISGMFMNVVIGWMHKGKKDAKPMTAGEQRAAQRAALKARLEKEKEAGGKAANGSASAPPSASAGTATPTKKGARQRKR